MDAKVIPFRPRTKPVLKQEPRSAGPCISGTVPGGISKPCGRTDTALFIGGPFCPDHEPKPGANPFAGYYDLLNGRTERKELTDVPAS